MKLGGREREDGAPLFFKHIMISLSFSICLVEANEKYKYSLFSTIKGGQ
jgi:hypothetical protein